MDRPTQRAIPIELQKYGEMLVKRKPRYFQSIKAAAAAAMVRQLAAPGGEEACKVAANAMV